MILDALCNSCLQAFRITMTPDHAHLVGALIDENGMAECPRQCGGRINLRADPTLTAMANDPRLRDPYPVTILELYQAIFGMGLPDEIPKSRETVEALLLAHPVRHVKLEEAEGALFLSELHLSNGVVVHLCSGHLGPRVLKITKGV